MNQLNYNARLRDSLKLLYVKLQLHLTVSVTARSAMAATSATQKRLYHSCSIPDYYTVIMGSFIHCRGTTCDEIRPHSHGIISSTAVIPPSHCLRDTAVLTEQVGVHTPTVLPRLHTVYETLQYWPVQPLTFLVYEN